MRYAPSPKKQHLSRRARLQYVGVGVAVLVAVLLVVSGIQWLMHRGDSKNDRSNAVDTTYNGPANDPNALPPTSGPNALDKASLQKDLKSLDTAVTRANSSLADIDAALADKPADMPGESAGLAAIKHTGDTELARRISNLNSLITLLSSSSNVSMEQRDSLNSAAGDEATNLVVLRAKLRTEDTASAAADDVAQLAPEYPAYALLGPKIRTVKSADNQQLAADKFANLQKKLATRVANAPGNSKPGLQAKLDEMNSRYNAAADAAENVQNAVLPLQVTTADEERGTLAGYRAQLANAQAELQKAVNLASDIVTNLD